MSRNKDVECPYCGEWQEICHDDGNGYSESEIHFQECADCDKTFGFETYITFNYESSKAPCQNGEAHKWKGIRGFPRGYQSNKQQCCYCGTESLINENLKYDCDNDKWVTP